MYNLEHHLLCSQSNAVMNCRQENVLLLSVMGKAAARQTYVCEFSNTFAYAPSNSIFFFFFELVNFVHIVKFGKQCLICNRQWAFALGKFYFGNFPNLTVGVLG
jgi:hypothetical protein